jgi:hypothetical protein
MIISVGFVSKQDGTSKSFLIPQALLARQFVPIPQSRITAYYNVFPRLRLQAHPGQTYVDAKDARFLFQPVENVFIVLITDLQSNILHDTETKLHILRVLASSLPKKLRAATIKGFNSCS